MQDRPTGRVVLRMTDKPPRTGALRIKPVEDILARQTDDADFAEEHGNLRKNLGAKDRMGFGVGIVIGTGIFTLRGIEAKKHAGPRHHAVIRHRGGGQPARRAVLGPDGLNVPTAGSASRYAYATIGEVFAWIIGWDLILKFALRAAVVA